jgi:2'-5' RNA ligase
VGFAASARYVEKKIGVWLLASNRALMRLFVAIDIEDSIRQGIARFLEGVQGFAPDARWVSPASFHVTLKFIGEWKDERLRQLQDALGTIESSPTTVSFRGYGFFPTTKSARVFWIGIEADEHLGQLGASVERALAPLGIDQEKRAFSPHLTLARAGSGRPQRTKSERLSGVFRVLQERLAAMPQPDFGTMTARAFFLYESKLSPKGAKYTKLASFPLS